jgi:O-acetyl-ADP-ribose deacetylase (regulator of RNase III)
MSEVGPDAVSECVKVARKNSIKTIVIPPIGTGRGLTRDEAADAMISGFRRAAEGTPLRVAVVVQGDEEYRMVREAFRQRIGPAPSRPRGSECSSPADRPPGPLSQKA